MGNGCRGLVGRVVEDARVAVGTTRITWCLCNGGREGEGATQKVVEKVIGF